MKNVSELYTLKERPIKVLQFGEGNFLRAFVDYAIDVANEELGFDGNVAIVIPRSKKPARFTKQNNIYTVCLRGKKNAKPYEENRVITCISKVVEANGEYEDFMKLAQLDSLEFVVSNTTEAGIVFADNNHLEDCPPSTFPGKLTKFLYERFKFFKGDATKALTMLPVELIDHNGETLKKCVMEYIDLWHLEAAFKNWIDKDCIFADTLVDRIVAGYPKDEAAVITKDLGYEDELLDKAEPFGLWVIGDDRVKGKLNISTDKLPIVFTNKLPIYKERKVRILNGAHTSMVLGAYLAGFDYVGQCMADNDIHKELTQCVFEEIVPTVHLPKAEAEEFAKAVFERFENPFVHHALLSISLNSIAKWRARILPTLKDSIANNKGKLPKWLTYSMAALLAFYHTTKAGDKCLIGSRNANEYKICDDQDKLDFIREKSALSLAEYGSEILKRADWWGEDLTAIPGFADEVIKDLEQINKLGAKAYISELGKLE